MDDRLRRDLLGRRTPADGTMRAEPLPDSVPAEERSQTLLLAGVWLTFLLIPGVSVAISGAGLLSRTVGIASLVLFAAVYLTAYLHPRPLTRLPRWVSTLAYSSVLAAAATVSVLAGAGPSGLAAAPFFVALWLFSHPWRVGAIGAVCVLVLAVVLALVFVPSAQLFWPLASFALATSVILAVRIAQHREEHSQLLRERLALADQRETFAREVHDVLGHSLTVVSVRAQLARRLIRSDPERAQAELDEVLTLTRESITATRAVVTRLAGANDLALDEQVHAAGRALESAGISARLPPPDAAQDLTDADETLFAACVREAVTNIIRHSGASRARVEVSPGRLLVVDDGVGGAHEGGGHGLAGMQARAQAASAQLTVSDDRPGEERPGTRVEVLT